jgi:hypothetical protein
VQSEVFAQEIGGHFAAVEAGFEVPQRALAPHRFVDGRMTRPVVGDVHEEGGVAAVGHAALDLDLALQQVSNRIGDVVDAQLDTPLLLLVLVVVRLVVELVVELVGGLGRGHQFIRGQAWPSGSIGKLHHWHGGRPASTTLSAWSQNAVAWPRLR